MYDIQKIKELEAELKNLSLTNYMEEIGAEYQNGRWFCPFHDETNPSLSVDDSKGIWHCFSCGKGGGYGKLVFEYMVLNDDNIKLYYQALEQYLRTNKALTDKLGFTSMKDGNYNRILRDKASVIEYVYGVNPSTEIEDYPLELKKVDLNDIEFIVKEMHRLQYQT